MIINQPRCDYIRLTTFEKSQYELLAKSIKDMHPHEESEAGNFLQYMGDWYSHAFHGQGEQSNWAHWLVQVSGELSDFALTSWLEMCKVDSVKCTRLDLQVTIPLPPDWNLREHVDTLRESDWPNRRRKVEFYENEGQMGTIYIGARSSDKFARLYVKYSGANDWPLCLRYEIELKGQISAIVFKTMLVGATDAGQILRGEFLKLPNINTTAYKALAMCLPHDGMSVMLPKSVPDENKTIRWLIQKVGPTIKRMLNSHEHGYRTREWIRTMLDEHSEN